MKTLRFCLPGGQFLILSLAILACDAKVSAQTTDSNLVPVVTVQATQPVATTNRPGVFTVFRAGNTNFILNVYYDLGGTASNGVDYAPVPQHSVTIPAGVISSTIVITPLINLPPSSAVKTVVLTLTNSPMLNPVNYQIGSPSQAEVYIESGGTTDLPPVVAISSPTNGQTFLASANIDILAPAYDPDGPDGFVKTVAFFEDSQLLGVYTNPPPPPGYSDIPVVVPHFLWTNVPPGNYVLTAVATDFGGLNATSAPVKISVISGPPPTNLPPVVRIVSPADGSMFSAPINLPIYAYASDPDGFVSSVQFFAGTNSLGFGQRVPVITPLADGAMVIGGPVPPIYPTNLFFLVWSNAPGGDYALTAAATDNGDASTTSAPVNIHILSPLPPPTNRPPIVSIVATDPVAIEGTNSWIWSGETNSSPTWAAWSTAVCRWFTNCAPKTATLAVRRCGETNDSLTVTYDIGGTASNGVDYVALPGFVTVPAGQRRALITIVPIDDGPPDVNKTVILALTASSNMPPDYLLGFPRRAAAIIIDGNGPRPLTDMLPGHCFHLKETGPNAAWFCIEYSTNLVNWTPVCTNQVIYGSIDFVDPNAAGDASRFYRAVPLANPPSE